MFEIRPWEKHEPKQLRTEELIGFLYIDHAYLAETNVVMCFINDNTFIFVVSCFVAKKENKRETHAENKLT